MESLHGLAILFCFSFFIVNQVLKLSFPLQLLHRLNKCIYYNIYAHLCGHKGSRSDGEQHDFGTGNNTADSIYTTMFITQLYCLGEYIAWMMSILYINLLCGIKLVQTGSWNNRTLSEPKSVGLGYHWKLRSWECRRYSIRNPID